MVMPTAFAAPLAARLGCVESVACAHVRRGHARSRRARIAFVRVPRRRCSIDWKSPNAICAPRADRGAARSRVDFACVVDARGCGVDRARCCSVNLTLRTRERSGAVASVLGP